MAICEVSTKHCELELGDISRPAGGSTGRRGAFGWAALAGDWNLPDVASLQVIAQGVAPVGSCVGRWHQRR